MTSDIISAEHAQYIQALVDLTEERDLGWHAVTTTALKNYGVTDNGKAARATGFRAGTLILVDGAGEDHRSAALYYSKDDKIGVVHAGDRRPLSKLLKAAGLQEPLLQDLDTWLSKSLTA